MFSSRSEKLNSKLHYLD